MAGVDSFALIAYYSERHLYADFYNICWSPNFSGWRMEGQSWWGTVVGKEVLTSPQSPVQSSLASKREKVLANDFLEFISGESNKYGEVVPI